MAAARKTFRFDGVVARLAGPLAWHYVAFPYDVAQEFGSRASVRVKGTLNGVPFDRALLPKRGGPHVIVVNGELRRKAKVKIGSRVRVELTRNERPEDFVLPEEIRATFELEPSFGRAWKRITPGVRRQICAWVGSAKRAGTRADRAAEILRRFQSGDFVFGGRPVDA